MELSEKLQELRKEKGLTQEELAEALFVSRTAISKWESGRGVPNIESLKAISKFFSVSIDELLSGEEILKIADEDNKQKEKHTRDLVFGLLDCSLIMFLFLPFFGQKGDEIIKEVSLLSLTGTPQYIKIPYLIIVFGIVLTGVLLLALQNYEAVFWLKHKHQISIVLSTVATIEFMITLQPYPFTFSYAGQDTANVEIAVNDGKAIENKLIYGSVSGKKITENGEALGGAVIGLFKADETEFTKENALMTATSQKDGSFSFEKVPYGNWIVKEIEQPAGFVLDDTSYEVIVSEDGQVIEVEIVNEYVHGNIKLTKVDEDYPDNKLTGATFEVYKDVNGDGKLDDGDELIGTLTETTTGIYEMKELLYGKYLVRETKAPEGFELDKGVYSVFIEEDETTYEVENKAGVGFINTAMKGNLKIVKTSSDGKVEGFTFRVTGANGYDRTFTTNKNGEIIIEGLRIGDYTISEVQDSVSASYVLPADKIATVKVGSTTVVEMHNELRDTPKTGDNSNVGLWTALAGLSALGIVGTAVVAYRKKKKEDNE